jgi:predicted nucleic-acid-binding protein
MVGIDTNVLIRFVVQDDKQQAAVASELIEDYCSAATPGLISLIVLCEFVWVLSSAYAYSRQQISSALKQILVTECFEVSKHDVAWSAMLDYSGANGDYADCLISRLNELNGAETTYTFDRCASRNKRFTLLLADKVKNEKNGT